MKSVCLSFEWCLQIVLCLLTQVVKLIFILIFVVFYLLFCGAMVSKGEVSSIWIDKAQHNHPVVHHFVGR